MKISELILHVGDEHIAVQGLNTSVTNVTKGKKSAKVTFETEISKGDGLMNEIALGKRADFTGIIVWLPTERLPK